MQQPHFSYLDRTFTCYLSQSYSSMGGIDLSPLAALLLLQLAKMVILPPLHELGQFNWLGLNSAVATSGFGRAPSRLKPRLRHFVKVIEIRELAINTPLYNCHRFTDSQIHRFTDYLEVYL